MIREDPILSNRRLLMNKCFRFDKIDVVIILYK